MTRLLLSRRPSPSLGSSIFQRLAPSSSGLAPALGRYSPPLCRRNKMAAAVPPCARIHSPPFVAPSAQTQALLPGGAHALWYPPFSLGRLLSPPARAFVCCFGPAHACTCWSTHPLTSRASQRAQKGKSPSFTRFTSLFRYIPGSRRMPGSYQFPRRETCLLCPEP